MASITITCQTKKKNKAGKSPVVLRLTHQRRSKYLFTKIWVDPEKEWNPDEKIVTKFYPNSLRTNKLLKHLSSQVHDVALRLNEKTLQWSEVNLHSLISDTPVVDFVSFGEEQLQLLRTKNQVRTAKRYQTTLRKLIAYRKNRTLDFADITVAFLMKYEAHLSSIGNRTNTIHSNMKTIRAIFNIAIRQGLVERVKNPFLDFKLKQEIPHKVRPSAEDFEKLRSLNLQDKKYILKHTRNAYLFSLYCAGIRVGDLLQLTWNDINGDVLSYTMDKTNKPRLITLTRPAHEILKQYGPIQDEKPIFPFLTKDDLNLAPSHLLQKISSRNAQMNRALKELAALAGIKTHLTMHTARHGFSELARKKNIDIYNISKALGHSSLSITQAYLNSFDLDANADTMTSIFE